jgi:hypothetical protein
VGVEADKFTLNIEEGFGEALRGGRVFCFALGKPEQPHFQKAAFVFISWL